MTKATYTTGQAAEILNIPHPTLKTYYQAGLLDFVRVGQDGSFQARRWIRYEAHEIIRIAVMVELIHSGVSPKLASALVDYVRVGLVPLHNKYLCVGRIDSLYTFTTAHGLADLEYGDQWYVRTGPDSISWRQRWLTTDCAAPDAPPPPRVPSTMVIVNMETVQEEVSTRIKVFQQAAPGAKA